MIVFRYEWKRNRKYILIWAVSVAACIFIMTPVYNSMVGSIDTLPPALRHNGFLVSLGMSLELLQTPIGMYAFLTNFFMLAGGIYGMHLGISLFTKDCTDLTAEYLYTKPVSRNLIFTGKILCMFSGIVIMGICYLAASFTTMSLFHYGFDSRECLLIAVSFPLHALIFGVLGIFIGVLFPRNRSALLTASLTVFLEYGIHAFTSTIDFHYLSFLSPFSYFTPAYIHEHGFYDWSFLLWHMCLTGILIALSYQKLLRRDIVLAA